MKRCVFISVIAAFVSCGQIFNAVPKGYEDVDAATVEAGIGNFEMTDSDFVTVKVEDKDGVQDRTVYWITELFDSVRAVRLSNDDKAVVGAINKIVLHDSLIILSDKYSTRSIKIFSLDGSYIRDIGHYGRADGEFVEPTDFCVKGDSIVVYDQFRGRVSFFTIGGKFCYSRRMPFLFMKFGIFDNGTWAFQSVNSDNNHLEAIVDYTVFTSDNDYMLTGRGFYRKKDTYESFLEDHPFFMRDNKIYYHPVYSDTIYSLDEEGRAKVEFVIDCGKKTLPAKYRDARYYILHPNKLEELQKEGRYLMMFGDFFLTDRYLMFSHSKRCRGADNIYDKQTGKLYTFYARNGFFPFHFANIKGSTDDAFIGYIFPGMVTNITSMWKDLSYDSLVKTHGKYRTDFGMSLSENDNPVITFFYVKK